MNNIIECPRCNGKGHIKAFSHVENGICFLCHGQKTIKIGDLLKLPKDVIISYQDFRNQEKDYEGNPFPKEKRNEYFWIVKNGRYGTEWNSSIQITDDNRKELRELWKALKGKGYTMRP